MNKSIIDKASLKEQLQTNVLQVFEDVNIMPNVDEKRDGTFALLDAMSHSDEFRDQVLDHMCDVIIETVNKAQ